MKQQSQRQLRVGEQLRHIIAETLQRGHFTHELLQSTHEITVSEVRPSPDLKNATAYVSSYIDSVDIEGVIKALNSEAKEFQKEIARQGNFKFTPRVTFKLDYSFDEAAKIENLLKDINS